MRSFIATFITSPELLNLLEELRSIEADTKVVKPENLHMTLKFLGEIREVKVDDINRALTESLSSIRSFEASLKGVGVFPNEKRLQVIWVGFENGGKFVEINESVETALEKIGFPRESRFHPHLTLARMKSPAGKDRLLTFLKRYESTPFGKCFVKSIELMKSTLTPQGPIYSTVKQVRLRD